jgi:uncharacterized membrane protein YkoI
MSAALLLATGSALAQPRSLPLSLQETEQEVAPLGPAQDRLIPAQRGSGISREDAIAKAQSVFPGRVASARTVQMGDRSIHEIRILGEDGTVRTFRIDAQTGAFL